MTMTKREVDLMVNDIEKEGFQFLDFESAIELPYEVKKTLVEKRLKKYRDSFDYNKIVNLSSIALPTKTINELDGKNIEAIHNALRSNEDTLSYRTEYAVKGNEFIYLIDYNNLPENCFDKQLAYLYINEHEYGVYTLDVVFAYGESPYDAMRYAWLCEYLVAIRLVSSTDIDWLIKMSEIYVTLLNDFEKKYVETYRYISTSHVEKQIKNIKNKEKIAFTNIEDALGRECVALFESEKDYIEYHLQLAFQR